jgi:hypothetical protein
MNLSNDSESPAQETFRKKRLLWCSEPDWQNKEVIDYYSDTLYLLCNDDDEHCLELSVGGKVVRLPIEKWSDFLLLTLVEHYLAGARE